MRAQAKSCEYNGEKAEETMPDTILHLICYEDPSVGCVRLHFPRAGFDSNRRRKPPKGLRPRANAALTR